MTQPGVHQQASELPDSRGGAVVTDRYEPAPADPTLSRLTSGRVLAWNTVWNLVGQAAPLLVAVAAIPILVHALGTDRFGILDLGWLVVGYLSLFDFGLGRALTLVIAERLGDGEVDTIPPVFWTSLALLVGFGLLGSVVGIVVSPWLVHDVLKVPHDLQPETVRAFYLLALSLPLDISGAGLRGALEAQQRFRSVGVMRTVMGLITFLAPLTVLPFSHRLVPIVAVMVGGRLIVWNAFLLLNLRALPALRSHRVFDRGAVRPLLRTGGWMTVSNVISPLMVSLDRFLVGTMISVSAVTYYGTPYDVVTKLLIVPGALTGVLFPAFAAGFANARQQTQRLFDRSVRLTFVAIYPIVLVLVLFAHAFLHLWLGGDFPEQSTHVLQWLAVGVLSNSVAQLPFALVQGGGRSDITAKLHLFELPIYGGLLWILAQRFGISGVAAAWACRVTLDAVVLLVIARHLVGGWIGARRYLIVVTGAVALLGLATLPMRLQMSAAFALIALVGQAVTTWQLILTGDERTICRAWVRTRLTPFRSSDRRALP